MNVVVTGGAGFIGSYLVKQLVKSNQNVTVIDSLVRGNLSNLSSVINKIKFHKIDIRDFDELKEILKLTDIVFHEAALTDVQESFTKQKEYYDVNVVGTENIFRLANKFGFKVVYASSSSIYGNPKMIPIYEKNQRIPINPYGQTKLEDEFLAEKYTKLGVSIIGLRYFNVYGKGQTGSYAGVITKFINNLKEKKPPVIFGNGTQLRDFVYVEDVALANMSAMQSNLKNGFFNVGTGIATSIQHLAKIMIEISGLKLEPQYEKALDGDVQSSQADTSLTESMLKWKYSVGLKEGLAKFFT